MMVSGEGLDPVNCIWVKSLKFNRTEIMEKWRFAVTSYLWKAHRDGLLDPSFLPEEFNDVVLAMSQKDWNIHITQTMSKAHFLQYAGRYIRRLPIAQRNILEITERDVVYRVKITRKKAYEITKSTLEEFADILAQHVLDRYQHSMRYLGLLAPRTKNLMTDGVLTLLDQKPRPKPRRLRWAEGIKKRFGVDLLLDEFGNRMHWVGRVKPVASETTPTERAGCL